MQKESNTNIISLTNSESLSNSNSLARLDSDSLSTRPDRFAIQHNNIATPNSSPSIVYVAPPDLTPILQQFQSQQLNVFSNIAKQQNRSLRWFMVVMIFFLTLVALLAFSVFYFYFNPIQETQKQMSQNLAEYQGQLQNKFTQQIQEMQKIYEHNTGSLSQESRAGYQQLLEFAQQIQHDYEKELALERDRKNELYHRQETLEQTVAELTTALTKAELSAVQITAENQQLQAKQKELLKNIEKQKEEIRLLRKQAGERLSPLELEKLRKELQTDD